MAIEFLADGIVPSAFSFDEIEKMINEQGIVPGEDEFLREGLARLVEVLRDVKRGK
jgi:hypothetical protein